MPGSPYTGSTLLGLLLDHHPALASVGAATGLTSRIDPRTYRCSCGARYPECAFWRRVARRTAELGHPVAVFRTGWSTDVRMSRRRWLNGVLVRSLGNLRLNAARDAVLWRGPVRRRVAEAALASWSLATAVLEATGKEVFVDTARDHQRPKYLRGTPRLDVRVIHLVRDPRGNVASIVRHTGADVASAARRWRERLAPGRRRCAVRFWLALGLVAAFWGVPTAVGAQSACVTLGSLTVAAYTQFIPTGYSPYMGFASYPGGPASGLLPPGYSPNPYSAPCTPAAADGGSVYYYPWNPYALTSSWGAGALTVGTYGTGFSGSAYAPSSTGPLAGYGSGSVSWGGTWSAPVSSPYGTLNYQPYGSSAYTGFASYPGLAPSGYASTGGYGAGTSAAGYGMTYSPYGYGYGGVTGYPAGYGSAWGYGGVGGYSVPSTVITWGCGGC